MEKRFLTIAKITLITVYLVVLAGSVVRMSGAGMGCPDWPKCFDCWIPPTDISQLPEDYEEKMLAQREEKIQKFANLLESIGFASEAELIRNDPKLREKEEFNATKTWTEYINRLVGFIAGNLMLISFIMSFWLFRKKREIFFLTLLNLFLIGFTAWFGAIVVATNLLPWIITVHMVLAFLIICVQISIINKADPSKFRFKVPGQFRFLIILTFLLLLAQIILGTQVRQQIDVASSSLGESARSEWTQNLDILFYIHRSLSILIFAISAYLSWKNIKHRHGMNSLNLVTLIFVIEILSGILLYYAGMPKILQPIHLLLSGIAVGLLLHLNLKSKKY